MLTTFENDLLYFNQIKFKEKSDIAIISFTYFFGIQLFVVYLYTLNYSKRNSFPPKRSGQFVSQTYFAWTQHVSVWLAQPL